MKHPVRRLARLVWLLAFAAAFARAQQHLEVPRADGKTTPLLVYRAEHVPSSCARLAVISHGAGGSEDGYRYLAWFMASLGYTTVVMGHRESGFSALASDMSRDGIKPGVRDLVADPKAESARLLDVSAALQWADSQCHSPYRVLLGHSMGAETTLLEAGAKNILGIAAPPAGLNRFDSYIALSPQGPGVVYPDHAWNTIRKPVLILTGTRDESVRGGPESRQIAFSDLPGAPGLCQWQGVIDNATHMNFAGTGFGHAHVEALVTQTISSFLAGASRHNCALPQHVTGMDLKSK